MESKHPLFRIPKTIGEKSADSLTKFMGSWAFIIPLLIIIVFWLFANIYAWANNWDPYPFMLLNSILAIMNAIMAPIILMSQNRQEKRDSLRLEYDYEINRKAEKEIREIKETLRKMNKK